MLRFIEVSGEVATEALLATLGAPVSPHCSVKRFCKAVL
jgi:hypothetical protein